MKFVTAKKKKKDSLNSISFAYFYSTSKEKTGTELSSNNQTRNKKMIKLCFMTSYGYSIAGLGLPYEFSNADIIIKVTYSFRVGSCKVTIFDSHISF